MPVRPGFFFAAAYRCVGDVEAVQRLADALVEAVLRQEDAEGFGGGRETVGHAHALG